MQVVYRQEEGGWSARCPEAPGYTAFAESFSEVVQLARDGIPFFVGQPVDLQEYVDTSGSPAMSSGTAKVSVALSVSGSFKFAPVLANAADVPDPLLTPA
jgi:predicted RNase H-like HicB family nuclease